MSIDDIEYKTDTIHVTVPKTKTNVPRLFVITEAHWLRLVRKYASLRPTGLATKRFFIAYRNGRCTNSHIGINKISQVPRTIAAFLNLPNPELYTGHCFRRSSASGLANNGGDLITVKKHGGWKSSAVAEGYIEASLKRKTEVANMLRPSTSTSSSANIPVPEPRPEPFLWPAPTATDNNKESCVINIPGNTNFQQKVVTQSLPGGVSINAQANSNVVVKVFTNCKFASTD